jgi:hypothetical protein
MFKERYVFPTVYLLLVLTALLEPSIRIRLGLICACVLLSLLINARAISRFFILILLALCTLIPLLLLVQGAVCSSAQVQNLPWGSCVAERIVRVLLNMGALTAIFLLASANEWRGSIVQTVNRLTLPRNIRMIAIIAGAMIGDFRRGMTRVHQAFTARGDATPAIAARNIFVLAPMLGIVWASVLTGVVERFKAQWSSEEFWERYVPSRNRHPLPISFGDLAVYALTCLTVAAVIGSLFAT